MTTPAMTTPAMTTPAPAKRLSGRLVLAAVLLLGLTTGCGAGDLSTNVRPASVSSDERELAVLFDDALNLSVGAPVKVAGVTVGRVTQVGIQDYRARVDLAFEDDTALPEDSRFRLRYTTALGEMYVEVTPGEAERTLADGALVDGPNATTAVTVEDTLASTSLLVNGGGLGQLQTVVDELGTALDGRVGATKSLLHETDAFFEEALRSTKEIDRVLISLADAAEVLDRREDTVNAALEDLRPAAQTLADNTDDLVRLLRRADRMSVTADRLVRRTRDDLLSVVDQLAPVLEEVLSIQDVLVPGLDKLVEFGKRVDHGSPGDYLNLKFLLHLDDLNSTDPNGPGPGEVPDLPEVPGLPELPPLLPGLPNLPLPELPGLPGLTADGPTTQGGVLLEELGLGSLLGSRNTGGAR